VKIIFEKEIKVRPVKYMKKRKLLGKMVVYEYGLVKIQVPREFIGKTAKVIIYDS